MSRMTAAAIMTLAIAGVFDAGLLAIRNKAKQESNAPKKSSEAIATEALNRGLERLTKGDRSETANPKVARKEFEAAVKDFQDAVRLMPDSYRAHNALGYALRKLGNYDQALASYEKALKLAPNFGDAIEYRAEAYLALNRLNDAKQSYIHLFVHDRANANVLMKAMKAWVAKHRKMPSGVDPSVLAAFETWVNERDMLASATVNLGHNSPDWK
jgi:tetratricopeptide (TPR) repeat protein